MMPNRRLGLPKVVEKAEATRDMIHVFHAPKVDPSLDPTEQRVPMLAHKKAIEV